MIIEKISYEHRAYESVDDRSYSLSYISKINGKPNSGTNGLMKNMGTKMQKNSP